MMHRSHVGDNRVIFADRVTALSRSMILVPEIMPNWAQKNFIIYMYIRDANEYSMLAKRAKFYKNLMPIFKDRVLVCTQNTKLKCLFLRHITLIYTSHPVNHTIHHF